MKLLVTIFLAVLLIRAAPADDFPQAQISNGLINATLYLPDTSNGYYRGTRFDWSGVIPHLEYKGHTYFAAWNPSPYDPKLHDAIMGPVEEFGPLGYADAKPGESFVKIGVGEIRKIEEKSYRFATNYEIINPGKWTIRKKEDGVSFTHELKDAAGYAYQYTKTVQLIKGQPTMVLHHTLKNTGQKAISTSVYNHNFFVIDQEPTGPNMKMTFPYDIIAVDRGNGSLKGFGTIAYTQSKSILYKRSLERGEQVYSSGLIGYGRTAEDYHITTENTKTGAGATITSDQPLEKLVYWACPTTACAEPYIRLEVAPGKTIKWMYNYAFYAEKPKK